MKNARSFEQKLARIYEVTGVSSDSALARILGIKAPSVAAARKREQIPSGWIEKIAWEFRVNAHWLFFGEGIKFLDEIFPPVSREMAASGKFKMVEVMGMANCNIKGWFNKSPLAVSAPLPMPDAGDDVFAVLAMGYSMVPAGVRPGHVVFCDPAIPPARDDIVFIERDDGKVSIKKLKDRDNEWVTVEGWLDPDSFGVQKPYHEKINMGGIQRLASVIFIRIKA